MSEKIVSIRHISKTFGGAQALIDVDFDLYQGEVHCVIGQNGCGKSTLIKIIAGVLLPDSGQPVKVDGVSVIYQDLSLFPNLTVEENIWFPLYQSRGLRSGKQALREKARESLEKLGVDLDPRRRVEELSVADRQLVAIARALVSDSRIIFMDEPTSSLTKKEVAALFAIVERLKAAGVSIVFVSHKLDEITEIADRITVMRDGRVLKTIRKGEADEAELSRLISGRTLSLERSREERTFDPVLEVRGLTRRGQFQDVSFTLGRGEVLGLAGSLGAGRTETALSIFGLNPADAGEILLEGRPVRIRSSREAMDLGIAYVPEDRISQGVAIDQGVESNLTATVLPRFRGKGGLLGRQQLTEFTGDWIRQLDIKSAAPELPVSGLSGGNQQKVVLAKWLAIQPKVLILDQPTNGIDIGAKYSIYEMIRTLADAGIGILLISDEPQEIYYNCDRSLFMRKGTIRDTIPLSGLSFAEFQERIRHEE